VTLPLALTVGDPAGIGPEIILGSLASLPENTRVVVYGARAVLARAAREIPHLRPWDGPVVEVLPGEDLGSLPLGAPSALAARLQYEALVRALDDALAGRVAGIVTAPWTKHILALAGLPPTGHTEVLAQRTGVPRPTMMLCGDVLRVALVTTHLPLAEVPAAITAEAVGHHLDTLARDLARRFGLARPRLAVCGLNPHAGEGGLMGNEERDAISPVVVAARARGLDVEGPFPADTLFARVARQRTHDAVLAMYHDQGLAPLKLWHFGESANVTLGLPIVRTSVDHGTAWDIAGQGVADPSSLSYALRLALRMCEASSARPTP
jgi:4-hydroxythreonine-4-phosphate dehydrogenase